MRIIILALIILCSPKNLFSQEKEDDLSSLLNKTKAYFEKADYLNIIKLRLTEKTTLLKTSSDSLLFANIFNIQGDAYYEIQDYKNAKFNYEKGILFCPDTKNGTNFKGKLLLNKSCTEEDLQLEQDSYNTVKEAEYLLSNIKTPDLNVLLDIYAKLGNDAAYMGFYTDSEYYLNKGLSIIKQRIDWKEPKNNTEASKKILFEYKLVYLFYQSKNEEKLLIHLKNIEVYKQKNKFNDVEHLMYAASLNCAGDYYLIDLENLDKKNALKNADFFLNKAISVLDKEKYPNSYIQFLFNKIKQLRFSKKYDEALNSYSEMMALVDKNDARTPFFLAIKVNIYSDMGDREKTFTSFFEMASKIHSDKKKLKQDGSNFKPSNTLNHTGLFVEIADELIEKFPNDSVVLKKTAMYYKMGLQQLKNSYELETFSNRVQAYYDSAIKGILKSKKMGYGYFDFKTILNDIENIENKIAWKQFLKNRNITKLTLPDSIFNEEVNIRQKLVLAKTNNDSSQILSLKNDLKKIQYLLQKEYPSISKYAYADFDIIKLQEKLNAKTSILKYKIIGDLIYIFNIKKESIELQTVRFSEKIKEDIFKYITILKNKKEDKLLAHKLFKDLIPYAISNYKNLIIIPDNILYNLPFETLSENKNTYLIENHLINYAAYFSFINQNKELKTNSAELYLFSPWYDGNNASQVRDENQQLFGARKESFYISQIFKNKHFSSHQATKYNFVKNASKASLIHLAMHANIDNEKPELSHFTFSGTSENSKLYLEELYALKLKANLAVLSACNTGTVNNDNSVAISLQRAFTLAGVPSTVSSLWDAPDAATQQIMVSFYKNLKKGFSKAEALQNAKIEYIKGNPDTNLSVPYYWAGFIISGDISPVCDSNLYSTYLWIAIIVSLMILVVFLSIKRFKKP